MANGIIDAAWVEIKIRGVTYVLGNIYRNRKIAERIFREELERQMEWIQKEKPHAIIVITGDFNYQNEAVSHWNHKTEKGAVEFMTMMAVFGVELVNKEGDPIFSIGGREMSYSCIDYVMTNEINLVRTEVKEDKRGLERYHKGLYSVVSCFKRRPAKVKENERGKSWRPKGGEDDVEKFEKAFKEA